MKEKFIDEINAYNYPDLVINIAKILGHVNPIDPDFERGMPTYRIGDIFKYLPHSITYNGHRGDLCITPMDISYFSVGGGWEHILVHFEPIPLNGTIYDAFYKMAKWLKENNLM